MYSLVQWNKTACVLRHEKLSVSPFLHDDTGLWFYNEPRSWIDALQHCRKNHWNLVEIRNSTVENKVESLLQNFTQNDTWIGLERPIFGCDASWKWISGETVQYNMWNSSTDPNSVNKYCGKIIKVNDTQTYKWSDANCLDRLPFICQGKLFSLSPKLALDCYYFSFLIFRFKKVLLIFEILSFWSQQICIKTSWRLNATHDIDDDNDDVISVEH